MWLTLPTHAGLVAAQVAPGTDLLAGVRGWGSSMKNLIATGHPAATDTAAEILATGGNAFDAVVGAAFVSCVAEPLLIGLGGGGFLLARTASGEEVLFDFFGDIPGKGAPGRNESELDFSPVTVAFSGADQTFHVGRGSVAVPGMLKGLIHVQARLGALPLAEVLAPAVDMARSGLVINESQAKIATLLEPILRSSPRALRDFTHEGGPLLGDGARYRVPELADFLQTLTEEPEGMYTGAAAQVIDRDMRDGGGQVTLRDLREYRVIERSPLEIRYRHARALTNPAPSLGGPLIGLALGLQQALDFSGGSWGSRWHVGGLAAVLTEVDRIRWEGAGIPGPGDARHAAGFQAVRSSTGGTTHLSVADSGGNVAALTGSNGEGSGYYVPGTGIMLNNMLGEDDLHSEGFHKGQVGARISSMMSPTILIGDDGECTAMGSGGSKRIRTAIHQVITNLVDFGLPLIEAVNRPRLHLTGGVFQVEPGFPPDALSALGRVYTMREWDRTDLFFGGVHAVAPGTGEAAGDHRRAGDARVC